MKLDRRTFLQSLAAATAALMFPAAGTAPGAAAAPATKDRVGPLLPQRRLGKTGEWVTMLGVGGWHLGHMSERQAQATIEAALAGGIRFFDTAEMYQKGGSEERFGKLLVPKYRDAVFLMTKTAARDARTARRHLEESLRRLRTDHLDLWQAHTIESPEDVDGRIEKGVLDVLREARASGKARFIGFTGHRTPAAHRRMLERAGDLDTCQMPVNVLDPSYESFVETVLPGLVQRKMGVLAMKTLSGGGFFRSYRTGAPDPPRPIPERVSVAEALGFAWSLPVSVVISGPDDPAQIEEKIALARKFEKLDEGARQALVEKVADLAGPRVEWYKA